MVCGSQSMMWISAWPSRSVFSTMRAMVATVSTGKSPTEVSPESMTASAPSRMALATSDASARVGRGLVIIDSSIWVATITGLAHLRAARMIRFWTSGTSSRGSSTPRSPRATMNMSNASMMSCRLAMACGFSSLAMTGTWRPSSSMISCTRLMSSPERTKDRATMSMSWCRAQRRSRSSLSLRAGTDTATPGRLMPLLLETGPGTVTSHTTSVAVTSTAFRPTLPSSMRM